MLPFAYHIDACVTQIHGISDADVENAPTWAVVGPTLWGWMEACRLEHAATRVTLVIHNASFDVRMMAAENARLACRPPGPPGFDIVDTLQVCRKQLRLLKSHRQCLVYQHLFQEEATAQHDALGDVRALVRICTHTSIGRVLETFRKPWLAEGFKRGGVLTSSVPQARPAKWEDDVDMDAAHKKSIKPCERCGDVYSTHFAHIC